LSVVGWFLCSSKKQNNLFCKDRNLIEK